MTLTEADAPGGRDRLHEPISADPTQMPHPGPSTPRPGYGASSFTRHPAAMATEIFAKIGDIKGESVDAKHKDEIEVLSFSWGVANSGSTGPGGGGGAG
ncbi:MAG: type VI secretion system tube protein Hcp, partial [Mycobacteriaceae bacterium]